MDYIIKRWKISSLGWNQKIQKVTVIGYIGVCTSMDRITPFSECLRRNIGCIAITESEQYRVTKMATRLIVLYFHLIDNISMQLL